MLTGKNKRSASFITQDKTNASRSILSFLLVSFIFCTFTAHAQLSCQPNGYFINHFQNSYAGHFGFPDDYANLAIGERVGPMREVDLKFRCTKPAIAQIYWIGFARKASPGITYDAASNSYTNPQLSARGLGFRIWWHQLDENNTAWFPAHNTSDLTQAESPYGWGRYTTTSGTTFFVKVPVRVVFVKLNNNFLNTNGTSINTSITANLFRFYLVRQSAPITPLGNAHQTTITLDHFSSTKRACTPLVNQLINFGVSTDTDIPAVPGVIAASTKTFSMTFHCPVMSYHTIGFKPAPVYGVLDQGNGVFGIKQGAGFASGIGIQISAQNVASEWTGNHNLLNGWTVLKPDVNYIVPAFDYRTVDANKDPFAEEKTRVVNFRASYYRMPGTTLQAGKVESAAIFHIVYK